MLADGRAPTKAEADTLVALQQRARRENRANGKGGGASQGKGGGKGKSRVLQLGSSSPAGPAGATAPHGADMHDFRIGLQSAVDRITTGGGAHRMSGDALQQTIDALTLLGRAQQGP
jgi:hypothetical protein